MEPLSVEMACLLGIQNKVQAVWRTLTTELISGCLNVGKYLISNLLRCQLSLIIF